MRKVVPFLALVFLAGCGGGVPSATERQTIETILRTPMTKADADALSFSGWDGVAYEEGGKTWKVVRVKITKRDETGQSSTKDVLLRYSGEPYLGSLDQVDNKAGDDWKKDVKSVKWSQ